MSGLTGASLDRLILAGIVGAAAVSLAVRCHAVPGLAPQGPLAVAVALLALRLGRACLQARRGDLPWGRLLLPGVLFAEGAAALLRPGPAWLWTRAATLAALEGVLLVLAWRVWRQRGAEAEGWPEARLALRLEAFLPPRAARMISVELVVLAGALRFLAGGWRQRPAEGGFSYHRDSSLGAILVALPALILADLLLVEVLLRHGPAWLRWAVHGLDAYGLLWLLGFWSSLRLRPHRVADGQLHLHRGILRQARVPLAGLIHVAPVSSLLEGPERKAFLGGAVPFGARGGAELLLSLDEPVAPLGLFGPGRPVTRLVVAVDDGPAFQAALTAARPSR